MDDLVKRLREGDPDLWAMKKAADRIESLEHELAETKLRASKIEILADRLAAILRKLCDVIDQNDKGLSSNESNISTLLAVYTIISEAKKEIEE